MPEFQSTRPVWAATSTTCLSVGGSEAFQSTRPVWAATGGQSFTQRLRQWFQSTRPVWAATLFRVMCVEVSRFQSTRPVWAATAWTTGKLQMPRVSIHAARVGRDERSDRDERPGRAFQSTRPVWAAT